MSFRVAQFNILGRHMAGTMWFHYAKDFLPKALATGSPDWSRDASFPRCLLWQEGKGGHGGGRFYRFPVLLQEIRALEADILCLVELDCFAEFQQALRSEGYDAVFRARPGKADGCGIFWRRDCFSAGGPPSSKIFDVPANDRIVLAQPLWHLEAGRPLLVLSTHLHYNQEAGYQLDEAREMMDFARAAERSAGADFANCPTVVCGDLNSLPGSAAYQLLCEERFADAAAGAYVPGSFTSLKPDVYYFALPRGALRGAGRNGPDEAAEEWHLQTGRQELLDYVLYDQEAIEVEVPPQLPVLDSSAGQQQQQGGGSGQPPNKKQRAPGKQGYGFWAGGWAFEASPAEGFEQNKYDRRWRPTRSREVLQLGIPNRLHGSDHIPVACTLRFRGCGSGSGGEDAGDAAAEAGEAGGGEGAEAPSGVFIVAAAASAAKRAGRGGRKRGRASQGAD